jgi:hypothetical protein
MRISDAAAAAGTTPRALRFYEANGLLPPPRRTRAGQRVYGPPEVARLRVIRELLGLGLTVADLRGRSCAKTTTLAAGDSAEMTLPAANSPTPPRNSARRPRRSLARPAGTSARPKVSE